VPLIQHFSPTIPILGVCLGHQAIGQAFGGEVKRAERPVHGKSSKITHDGKGIFKNLPQPLKVGRYHSLIVDETTLPDCLKITATAENGEIMALQHASYPIYGVQFHPESVLTEKGYDMLANFISV
jgi:anthranilate synthase/aminodeoxychorismate synthase-like glutamine amidotransferase